MELLKTQEKKFIKDFKKILTIKKCRVILAPSKENSTSGKKGKKAYGL